MKGTIVAARALYCLTFGVLATGVGGVLWQWSPPVGIVVGVAMSFGAGVLCETFLDALRRAARKDDTHAD